MDPTPEPRPRRVRRRLRRALISSGLALTLVTGAGTAWALDRFVVPHVEIADVAAYEAEHAGVSTADESDDSVGSSDSEVTLTDTSYASDDASIDISTSTTGSGSDTVTYYVADVVLSDATVLRSAFADNQFGENITALVSEMAEDHDAILAINGDYYGFRDTGIVIRNGVVYRDEPAREGFVFYADGTVELYDETQTSAEELLAAGAWNTLSFGPALVADGEVVAGIDDVEIDTNFGNHSIQG
ncbi:MAG: phosphodiester glycosidase family protein, partial [Cellulomonadaceae bacterium]